MYNDMYMCMDKNLSIDKKKTHFMLPLMFTTEEMVYVFQKNLIAPVSDYPDKRGFST